MSIRTVDGVLKTVRGTSNGNQRGSAEQRRKRKVWLIEAYKADIILIRWGPGGIHHYESPTKQALIDEILLAFTNGEWPAPEALPTCRCYRCGKPLTFETVTVDRIIPGCKGGTYRRNNIRPACGGCNSETGGALSGHAKRSKS